MNRIDKLNELSAKLDNDNISESEMQSINEEISRIKNEIEKEKMKSELAKVTNDGGLEKIETQTTLNFEDVFLKYASNEQLTADEENLIIKQSEETDRIFNETKINKNGDKRRLIIPPKLTAQILNDKKSFMNVQNMETTKTFPQGVNQSIDWGLMSISKDAYAFLDDTKKTYVPGLLKLPFYKGVKKNEASVLTEDETMDSEENDFDAKYIEYFEIGKAVDYSTLLQATTGMDFARFFVEEMQENVRGKLARLSTRGKGGIPGTSGRETPYGIITDIEENHIDKIIEYDGELSVDVFLEAEKKLTKGDSGASWYANKSTITDVKAVTDATGRPLFTDNYSTNNNMTPLGKELKEDSSIPDDYVILADAVNAYRWNFIKGIVVEFDKDIKARKNSITVYLIGDGAMVDENRAVLIRPVGKTITSESKKRK